VERRTLAVQEYGHPISPVAKNARRNESVAAIVARPRKNRDAGSRRHLRRDLRDRCPSPLHQRNARHPRGNRRTVAPAHFFRSEKLDQRNSRTISNGYCDADWLR
jgi:hypothetical protein